MKSFTISGQVQDIQTKEGICGLKVEAWDKDILFNDLVASTVTAKNGAFNIQFTEAHYRECFLDRRPDLFFKVYRGQRLIASTEDSVLWNPTKESKPVIIEVELPEKEEKGAFLVKGTVLQQDKQPLINAKVELKYRRLRTEHSIGKTLTDNQGYFEFHFTKDQLERAEKQNPNLIGRVYDPETGQLLLDEFNICNAGAVEEVKLVVQTSYSEYERFMAKLTPALDGVPVADLKEKDVQFLYCDTGLAADHIESLSIAARLGKQTDLPPEIFYGLFRQKLPTMLSDLLEKDVEELEAALNDSFKTHLIPLRFQKDLDDYLKRLSKLKETDPGVHRKKQKEKLRSLLKVDDIDDAKVDAVVEKAGHATMVNDKLLKSMVEADELTDSDAKAMGLTVTLSNLLDYNRELVKHLKTGSFSSISEGKVKHIEDLIAFEKSDWLEILEQEEVQPSDGWNREGYAALLAKKVENLYPSKTLLTRVAAKATDGVAQDLEDLQPLFVGRYLGRP